MVNIENLRVPKSTKEFAKWLRDIADQADLIPDVPLNLLKNQVEVGFYYDQPNFNKPIGLYFQVGFASTKR